jgi:hypothetical protein
MSALRVNSGTDGSVHAAKVSTGKASIALQEDFIGTIK